MGLDYYLIATPKAGLRPSDPVSFIFSRTSLIGQCMLSYFAALLEPEFADGDTFREYPYYRITLKAWDVFTGAVEEKRDEAEYLSSFVESVYDFDDETPDTYGSMKEMDRTRAVRFDRWFSEFFGVPAVFPSDGTVTEVAAGGLERIIDRAFALYRWLPMCGEVREYLKRNDHTVRIGRG